MMFSRSSGLTFLAISLCVQAIPHFPQEQCNTITTVIQTVTVMAAPAATSDPGRNTGSVASVINRGTDNSANITSPINSATPTPHHAGDNNNNNGGFKSSPSSATVATPTMRHGGNAHSSTASSASAAASAKSVTGSNGTGKNNGDPQTSLTLDPRVIAKGFANDGQDVPAAGQAKSLTSANNFINFCLTVPSLKITNGKQIATGSCNPAPMGLIPSSDNMPSSKFTFPKNFGTVKANQTFTIEMAIRNMQTGFFVNADANYFAAPQQLNAQGQIQGHSHVVIEELRSLDQTTPTNPKNFVFFKGLNAAAANGKLSAAVPNGLNVGFYKLSSINTASNHQPILVPIAQHGSLDDAIYFSVTSDGNAVSKGGKSAAPKSGAGKSSATSATARVAVATPLSMKGKRELGSRFTLKF